jgi:tRNA-dihydrouridine synthase
MIGRGAQGRPWLLSQVAAALEGRAPTTPPVREALLDVVCGHYEAMLGFYGVDLGLRVARKHLGWYMQAAGTVAGVRRAILTSTSPSQVTGLLRRAFTTNLEVVA